MQRSFRLLDGDARKTLQELEDQSVQACVTSPPYWGLRDYGVEGMLGMEASCSEFVKNQVAVFREVRRTLKPDGTLWLNMGDTYVSHGGRRQAPESNEWTRKKMAGWPEKTLADFKRWKMNWEGLGKKQLVGVPWRLAFALQDDGWILREDIIWAKPNPMPESAKDRCTRSHEFIFHFSVGEKYKHRSEAIREKGVYPAGTKAAKGSKERKAQPGVNARPPEYHVYDGWRAARSVWEMKTAGFKGAHFATFPQALPRRCILASTDPGDTVLDPYGGSGTTGLVALEEGRDAILCELNPEYAQMCRERCMNATPGLGLDLGDEQDHNEPNE